MLKSKQKRCIELMLETELSQTEIAEQLKISRQTITNWKKNDEFISEYNSAVKLSIKDIAAKALEVEKRLLSARSEMVRFYAAKDILDRAGFKPEDNVNVKGMGNIIFEGELNE